MEGNHSPLSSTPFPCEENTQIGEGADEQPDDSAGVPGVFLTTPLECEEEHDDGWGKE
jgi:hypothetical protein